MPKAHCEVAQSHAREIGEAREQDAAADACRAEKGSADLSEGDPTRWHTAKGPAISGPFGKGQQPGKGRDPGSSVRGEGTGEGEHRRLDEDKSQVTDQGELVSPREADNKLPDTGKQARQGTAREATLSHCAGEERHARDRKRPQAERGQR
jgi:hypothetical protein